MGRMASARKLVSTMDDLKYVMKKDTPEDALVTLVDFYAKMEPLYIGNIIDLWKIGQFIKFFGLPKT
jgi:hypothetical protein